MNKLKEKSPSQKKPKSTNKEFPFETHPMAQDEKRQKPTKDNKETLVNVSLKKKSKKKKFRSSG